MVAGPKITFIGAGSTVFMKNIVGDVLQRPALANAHISLMDIDQNRLEESELVARKLISTLKCWRDGIHAPRPAQSLGRRRLRCGCLPDWGL